MWSSVHIFGAKVCRWLAEVLEEKSGTKKDKKGAAEASSTRTSCVREQANNKLKSSVGIYWKRRL